MEYPRFEDGKQASADVSVYVGTLLWQFLEALVQELDAQIDKRLVRTFMRTVAVIITFRHNANGLLLSELGGYILAPDQAPAGTKRLSNLLRSRKWSYQLIERFLWRRADALVQRLRALEETILVIWDESVLEKAESIALEGLCPVRSTTAARLKRIKPGYFNPPGGSPIFVPGMQWVGILVAGLQGVPTLATIRWWTTRGPLASDRRTEERYLLTECIRRWGSQVLHIWDRGFAGSPWLGTVLPYQVRFVMRWPKHYCLLDAQACKRKAWELTRGKRSWEHRQIWDARRRCWRTTGLVAVPVTHPDYPDRQLWLLVARSGSGRSPWYLLTSVPVTDAESGWHLIFAYARRWQIEMAWRYCKYELAFESPRLWRWENRLKLLLIASLAYAFLLSLLAPALNALCTWLLRFWCHRTGTRCRDEVSTPLYRIRSALSRLWLAFQPPQPALL